MNAQKNGHACNWHPWLNFLSNLKRKYSYPNDPAFLHHESQTNEQLSIYEVVNTLSCALSPFKTIVTGSSGLCVEAFYLLFKNKPFQRILINSGLGSMGYGLPALIGAALAGEQGHTILFEGDGSLQMNIQELATIKGNDLNVIILVINNGGYLSIRNSQTSYFNSCYIGCDQDSGLHLPDLESLTCAYGLNYLRCNSTKQITSAISDCSLISGPSLIEIICSTSESLNPRVSSFATATGQMVSMPLEDMTPLLALDELKEVNPYNILQPASVKARSTV